MTSKEFRIWLQGYLTNRQKVNVDMHLIKTKADEVVDPYETGPCIPLWANSYHTHRLQQRVSCRGLSPIHSNMPMFNITYTVS
jgi:hypothetical protein